MTIQPITTNLLTNNSLISVKLSYAGATEYRISQDSMDFSEVHWNPYATTVLFQLTGDDGKKTLYAQFRNASHSQSQTFSAIVTLDTTPPTIESMKIDNGAIETDKRLVDLGMNVTGDPMKMQLFNEADFTEEEKAARPFIDFSSNIKWLLSSTNGQKTVLARFMDPAGNVSSFAAASILLDRREPIPPKILTPTNNSVVDQRIVEVTGTAEPNSVVIITVENID